MSGTRFTDKYLQARQMYNRGTYSYAMPLPLRSDPSKARAPTSPTRTSTDSSNPHSPPRKVVSDFAAFGAPANASVFGTKVASSPFSLAGGKAAFGGMRGGGMASGFDADDDDDEGDDGRQRIGLSEGSISLDQVRNSFFMRRERFLTSKTRPGA